MPHFNISSWKLTNVGCLMYFANFIYNRLILRSSESKTKECANFKFEVKSSVK